MEHISERTERGGEPGWGQEGRHPFLDHGPYARRSMPSAITLVGRGLTLVYSRSWLSQLHLQLRTNLSTFRRGLSRGAAACSRACEGAGGAPPPGMSAAITAGAGRSRIKRRRRAAAARPAASLHGD